MGTRLPSLATLRAATGSALTIPPPSALTFGRRLIILSPVRPAWAGLVNRMNLRDQLREILPEILPANAGDAIKGTELIRLVKYRLRQEYSDATLRYHFSILCCDPSAPIAKVDQGQGYYLRQNRVATLDDARTLAAAGLPGVDLFQGGRGAVDLALARVAKVRALFLRLMQNEARFPFAFSPGSSPESLWKHPDFAVIDWELEAGDTGFRLNRDLLDLKMAMGLQPFTATSVKLILMASHDNVREAFFQALSGSRWAHAGELVIAAAITDEQLADDLRHLGADYGLGVTTLGLRLEALDELADAPLLLRMDERALESLQTRLLARRRITTARPAPSLNWRLVSELRRSRPEFREFVGWLQACLQDGAGRAAMPLGPAQTLGRVSGL